MRATSLLVFAAALGLIATFVGVGLLWSQFGLTLSVHGWIAYGLGCLASLSLAAGLFYLSFKSSRDGYDDRAKSGEMNE